jgi:hypothetical protein
VAAWGASKFCPGSFFFEQQGKLFGFAGVYGAEIINMVERHFYRVFCGNVVHGCGVFVVRLW